MGSAASFKDWDSRIRQRGGARRDGARWPSGQSVELDVSKRRPEFNHCCCYVAISLIANVGSQVGLAGAVTVECLPWYTFTIATDVYVFNGRVVSPVWTLESCDLETVSTREG